MSPLVIWYSGRVGKGGDFGQIRLPESEAAKLMTDHVPASLHFSSLSYSLGGRVILDSISGSVKPGQVMAIMGASGAGKLSRSLFGKPANDRIRKIDPARYSCSQKQARPSKRGHAG